MNDKRHKTTVYVTIVQPKVDWAQIMMDLHNHGCSVYRVALTLCVDDCTARNWSRGLKGGEPGYGYGRALIRLHSAYCGAALTTRRLAEADAAMDTVSKRLQTA